VSEPIIIWIITPQSSTAFPFPYSWWSSSRVTVFRCSWRQRQCALFKVVAHLTPVSPQVGRESEARGQEGQGGGGTTATRALQR
jgi:hypothetical protein